MVFELVTKKKVSLPEEQASQPIEIPDVELATAMPTIPIFGTIVPEPKPMEPEETTVTLRVLVGTLSVEWPLGAKNVVHGTIRRFQKGDTFEAPVTMAGRFGSDVEPVQ